MSIFSIIVSIKHYTGDPSEYSKIRKRSTHYKKCSGKEETNQFLKQGTGTFTFAHESTGFPTV